MMLSNPFARLHVGRCRTAYIILAIFLILILLLIPGSTLYKRRTSPSSILSNTPPPTNTTTKKPDAYVTFLSNTPQGDTHNQDLYYHSARLLVYQFLHNESIHDGRDFIVMVNKAVEPYKIKQLREDGAIVKVVDDVPHPYTVVDRHHTVENEVWSAYAEMYTKLRIYEFVEYGRLLFIDADTVVMHRLPDEVWKSSTQPRKIQAPKGKVKKYKGVEFEGSHNPNFNYVYGKEPPDPFYKLFEKDLLVNSPDTTYVFASVPDDQIRGLHPDFYFNAGLFMVSPSKSMYDRLASLVYHQRVYGGTRFGEQNMLNYVFRRNGPMPWMDLPTGTGRKFWSMSIGEKECRENALIHVKFWTSDAIGCVRDEAERVSRALGIELPREKTKEEEMGGEGVEWFGLGD